MKNSLILAFIVFAGWKFYTDHISEESTPVSTLQSQQAQHVTHAIQDPINKAVKVTKQLQRFKCDGRQHCSQMTSYEEAKYFIEHCPDTKMDGDDDGIPCERQFNKW